MPDSHHAIQIVSRRTGLSAHVIRIWEKRYSAVAPRRTPTNRRLYSEEQIERLVLLRKITQSGHSIGHIARLSTDKLKRLVTPQLPHTRQAIEFSADANDVGKFLHQCLNAVRALDPRELGTLLDQGAAALGAQGVLHRVIAPMVQTIGQLWREGSLTAAHEHFASAALRVFLGQASKPSVLADAAPVILVTTPIGQLHELGALLVCASAANLGWQVLYLGANLPAAEIAGAALQNRVRVVGLSLVYPEDDSRLEGELKKLRQLLPRDVSLLIGGRAMPAYRHAVKAVRATSIRDLVHFGEVLDGIRGRRAGSKK